MFDTITEYNVCNDASKQDCNQCWAKGSVSKVEARRRRNFLIAKVGMTSEFFWECEKCGWRSAPDSSVSRLAKTNPNSTTSATAHNNSLASASASEMNPMYRAAEMWHRPPSFMDDLPLKMPALRPESSSGPQRE